MAQHRHRIRPFHLLSGLLVALLAVGLSVSDASAQGTNGQFPDPLTSRDLDEIASRLGLSPQQRQAIDLAHGEYRIAFAALREGEIEQHLQDQTNTARNAGRLGVNLDRDQVEKTAREYKQISIKIERLDEQFFDQMQPVLSEQQSELMPRIRMARARDRYDTGPSRFTRFVNPGSRVDLSELFRDLKLGPDEFAALDPLVAQYERDLTAAMRKYSSDAREQQQNMLKRVEAAGITEQTMNDRRAARRAMQTIRTLWEENNRQMAEESASISELNKRTFRTLVELLPAEPARQFRSAFVNQVYGEAAPVIGRAERQIQKALEIEALPDALREEVEVFRVATVHEIDRLTDGLVKLVDENRNAQSIFEFDREKREQFEQDMNDLRQARENANEVAIETLHAMLGEEYAANLRKPQDIAQLGEVGHAQAVFLAVDAAGGASGNFVVSLETDFSFAGDSWHEVVHVDPYIPQAISGRDVHTYANLLGVDDAMQPVLDTLHADYQEAFKVIEGAEIKQVSDIQKDLWKHDAETHQTTPPDEDDIEKLYRLRRRALDAIRILDGTFFDDMELAFVTEENEAAMTRIRLDRERQMYNRGIGGGDIMLPGGGATLTRVISGGGGASYSIGFPGGSSNESRVDLAKIVSDLDLDETQRAAIDGIMATYEGSAAEAFRRAFEANMAVQEAQDKRTAESMRSQTDGNIRAIRFNGSEGAEGREAVTRARKDMSDLNRQTLNDLMTRLDPEAAQALEDAYNRQAFPEAFADHRDVSAKLTAAMALDDLTSRQQQDLMDLSLTHRAEYRDLTDQMIEVIQATPADGPNRFEGFQQRMQTMERYRFTRNDLNDRSLAHLRTILTEEQIERLGGLETAQQQSLEFADFSAPASIQIRR